MPGTALQGPTRIPSGPVYRGHGAKWRKAEWIIRHFPAHRVYVEPFAGMASVLMQKPRSRVEILNDADAEIFNVFRVMRDPISACRLSELIELTPFSEHEFQLTYEPAEDPVERARRFIARSFLGCSTRAATSRHRTGFRYNDQPGGAGAERVWSDYPERIAAFVSRLSGVVLVNRDACEVIERRDRRKYAAETLYYCDPPYVQSTRQGLCGGRTYRHDMTDEDHRRLAEVLRSARGMVLLSGYPSELYDELYPDWQRVESIAWADGAKERLECLWLNPQAAQAGQRRLWD